MIIPSINNNNFVSSIVYEFPIAAITNYYKFHGLKQPNLLSYYKATYFPLIIYLTLFYVYGYINSLLLI